MKLFLLFFSLIFFSSTLFAAEYKGKVVAVIDGDTVNILINGKHIKTGLAQIDAPEISQPYGLMSKSYLSRVIEGQWVRIIEEGQGEDEELLGRIYKGDFDVNAEMVKMGLAWFDVRSGKDKKLRALEKKARADKRGLWQDSNPTPPWE